MTKTKGSPYVVVRNGQVELRRTDFTGAIQVFASGATSATLTGNVIIVTMKTGKTAEYRLTPTGNSAVLVRML